MNTAPATILTTFSGINRPIAEPKAAAITVATINAPVAPMSTERKPLTEDEVLRGHRFEDAVANGTYRVDVHHSDRPGLTFRYLDGREDYVAPGRPRVRGRWREEGADCARFYQIPFRSLVPRDARNLTVASIFGHSVKYWFFISLVQVMNCS